MNEVNFSVFALYAPEQDSFMPAKLPKGITKPSQWNPKEHANTDAIPRIFNTKTAAEDARHHWVRAHESRELSMLVPREANIQVFFLDAQ